MTGGGSVMVWVGISLEGCTDLYRLDNDTLTAIRYQDEILGPVVRPYAGAVGPGFLLVHNNAQAHVMRVCRQFLENKGIGTIDWPTGSPDLNPIEYLLEIMFWFIRCHQVALQTVQELSDALVQIWEEIPQDTMRQLIRSVWRPYKLLNEVVYSKWQQCGAVGNRTLDSEKKDTNMFVFVLPFETPSKSQDEPPSSFFLLQHYSSQHERCISHGNVFFVVFVYGKRESSGFVCIWAQTTDRLGTSDESRFYLSTCDRRDRLWRRCGECYAACNIIQHDWFGRGSVMVWGGISLEGRTDLYRLDDGTLTAIRYQDEILGPVVRSYAGAVGPGFLLVHNNARAHVARVCRQFLENEVTDVLKGTRQQDLSWLEPSLEGSPV
ncbi:hypothetical protein NFI96_000200 [Prochilodus magdalenae]|nr:hypothetical protein NFI96_000200 [Prochilodus magdalenae]